MSDSSRYYESSFKKRVIDFYLRNQPNLSFRSVANHFQIPGGHATVKRWYDRSNGNISSLQHHHRSGRASILNKKQINNFITMVIRSHNRLSRPINYAKLVKFVLGKLACDEIATLRLRLQRVSSKKTIFLDETHIKINEVPTTTLVDLKEMPYVAVTDSSSYAACFDMIAAIVGVQVLPPIVYSPQDRKTREVKGINSQMLIDFIEDILCPAINALDLFPQYLVLDK
ncbi:unnamed protein product [Rotaria sp. Silwood1]|nr:unnamed protein product [Rotaria sp. Silwood1]CAF4749934.1 unnamed protein product [Rotaria sp. Silwood1]CAF4990331.1 unnamed protein product [Rotaria sp. Silwood1]